MVIGCGDVVWAEDFQSEYRFRDRDGDMGLPAWFPDQQRSSSWSRQTLESERNTNSPGPSIQPIPQGNSFTPPVTDYAEPPPGLPRGLYRQVERRHTITPQLEGYKFRPIAPAEQVRNKARGDEGRSSGNADSSAGPIGKDIYPGFTPMDGHQPRPVYRPDKRLDMGTRQDGRRYPYGSAAPMPRFRPQ